MRFLPKSLLLAALLTGVATAPPTSGREPSYVGSGNCAGCHQKAYDSWTDSHHGWAWRLPTADNILGDFSDVTFEHQGVQSRFFQRDGRYLVETNDASGQPTTYEIAGTVGITPLQQYLVEFDDGRLQALDIVWDTEQKRWYHLYPEQELAGDPGLHWTGPYRNWNSRCVSCHVTGFTKGYQPRENRYESQWSEMGVGCEACHGPGEAHIAWAEKPGLESLKTYTKVDDAGLTVSFEGANAAEVCAGCHSRRESLDADTPPPGSPFDENYRLTLLREGLYHADGQIEDEVYVYGSFLQSKMHTRGVSCGDCHQPHSAELVFDDINAVCTQCHNPEGRKDYPTLKAASYVSPVHHRHRFGSEATQCVNCHMPETTYMGVDPRRDHSFRVPRPDLTLKLDTPNACNGCHTDQTAEWAQQQVEGWFPQGHHLRPHYGEVLHAGRKGLTKESVQDLINLALRDHEPAIVRASALELLAPVASPPVVGQVVPLLEDPSPLVRSATLGLFHSAPARARAENAGPLVEDSVRSVRIAAAQRILDIPTNHLSPEDQAVVKKAIGEYGESLSAQADFPEVQLNLSRYAERLGNRRMAGRALQAAVTLDPKLAEAWLRLAQQQVDAGRFQEARATLKKALAEVAEGQGALHQLLGRVLLQLKDESGALVAFEKAFYALPEELEVRVEYASLLANLGEHRQSLGLLERAQEAVQEAAPIDPQVLYLRAYNYLQLGERQKAWEVGRKLADHHPDNPLTEHLHSLF